MSKANLIPPYGGKLVNLIVTGKERDELIARVPNLPSIKISMRGAMRPGIAGDRWVLAAGPFHGQGNLRACAARDAHGRRHPLAVADHPDCQSG